MSSRKRAHGRDPSAMIEMIPDVGEEASFFRPSRGGDRKVKQLCREVHRTLSEVLSGEVADDRIAGLVIDSVEPAPDASRLAVILIAPCGEDDGGDILERLNRLRGLFRAEIAAAIQRKRTPELEFQLISQSPGAEGADDFDEQEVTG